MNLFKKIYNLLNYNLIYGISFFDILKSHIEEYFTLRMNMEIFIISIAINNKYCSQMVLIKKKKTIAIEYCNVKLNSMIQKFNFPFI